MEQNGLDKIVESLREKKIEKERKILSKLQQIEIENEKLKENEIKIENENQKNQITNRVNEKIEKCGGKVKAYDFDQLDLDEFAERENIVTNSLN